jgi:hypothetical protein
MAMGRSFVSPAVWRAVLVGLVVVVGGVGRGVAQSAVGTAAAPNALFTTVEGLDTALFTAYNKCDIAKLGTMVSDDLEFYHDQTGLSVGKKVFLESIQNNICGKVERELVPGSMEVYPLKGFGAVEIGSHRFRHPGHEGMPMGEAKFVEIWQNKDGAWKLTRVISYDHYALDK